MISVAPAQRVGHMSATETSKQTLVIMVARSSDVIPMLWW